MLVRLNGVGFIQSNGRQLIFINSCCMSATTLFRRFGNSVTLTSHKKIGQSNKNTQNLLNVQGVP